MQFFEKLAETMKDRQHLTLSVKKIENDLVITLIPDTKAGKAIELTGTGQEVDEGVFGEMEKLKQASPSKGLKAAVVDVPDPEEEDEDDEKETTQKKDGKSSGSSKSSSKSSSKGNGKKPAAKKEAPKKAAQNSGKKTEQPKTKEETQTSADFKDETTTLKEGVDTVNATMNEQAKQEAEKAAAFDNYMGLARASWEKQLYEEVEEYMKSALLIVPDSAAANGLLEDAREKSKAKREEQDKKDRFAVLMSAGSEAMEKKEKTEEDFNTAISSYAEALTIFPEDEAATSALDLANKKLSAYKLLHS